MQPHVTHAEEAIHRLAGGRSLLDAAMTMQQDRVRATADEAFADSLARFRENLGTVEQVLNESAQVITGRNLEELESKTADIKHHTLEEMFKSAEWYEKKAQTQMQNLSEKLVEQSGAQLREKAGEVSSVFSSELNQASRGFVDQTQQHLEESVRDAFERVRVLFAEAADTTTAAFTDEIQRNARQELAGFNELMQKTSEQSQERLDAARLEFGQHLTSGQEEFLLRFQSSMHGAVERGLAEAQGKVQSSFGSVLESWKAMGDAKQAEMRNSLEQISEETAAQYRGRLEKHHQWLDGGNGGYTGSSVPRRYRQDCVECRREVEGSDQRSVFAVWRDAARTVAADCHELRAPQHTKSLSVPNSEQARLRYHDFNASM